MCAPARPLPFSRCGANRQALAWPWLMPPRKKREVDSPRIERSVHRRRTDAVGTVTTTTTAPAIPVTPATPAVPAGIDWGIRLSWKAIAGIATLLALAGLGVKAVTYTNNLAHSITTLAEAVGKLDGTIGTVTSDIASIKQRMAASDATEASRAAEMVDLAQRQQRMEQAIADLRAAVAAAGAPRK